MTAALVFGNFYPRATFRLHKSAKVITNALELLKHSEANPTINQRARGTIERQLSHMVRLVDDLLDLSRINRDKLELQKQPIALSDVVSQAVETVRPLISEARHELTIDLPPEPLQLNADTVRLSQAFSNLLNNACKYTDPGNSKRAQARCRVTGHRASQNEWL